MALGDSDFGFLFRWNSGQSGSEISFGEVDNSKITTQITWTPVTSESWWEINMQG